MKDWKKAVLFTLIGFCLISLIVGIFELFAFLQMASTKITTIYIRETARNFYKSVTVPALICAAAGVALITAVIIFIAKSTGKNKLNVISLIIISVILLISIFFIVFAFCTQNKLKKFGAFNEYGEFYTSSLTHYQSYLSAMLSTFLPLLIACGIIFGYLIYGIRAHKREEIADYDEQEYDEREYY